MKNQAYERVFEKIDKKNIMNGRDINDIRDRFIMQQKYLLI